MFDDKFIHSMYMYLCTVTIRDFLVIFQNLVSCKEDVVKALELNPDQVELSMGMSTDYEHAVSLKSVQCSKAIYGWFVNELFTKAITCDSLKLCRMCLSGDPVLWWSLSKLLV